ncbi:MAG TPA: hypothetical protein H9889_06085 [Candidatus Ignatzschineria merdigallinarum]|uniref:Uncharacterized protein n=1 Tax=Candidatus Ignatzschineria merdigallinarum TaxID=2838621 RepID=A0A9D1Q5J0_9GAMM|nr:hypothetical protein [Candidatus Ignatzschineria merdigallinarum]
MYADIFFNFVSAITMIVTESFLSPSSLLDCCEKIDSDCWQMIDKSMPELSPAAHQTLREDFRSAITNDVMTKILLIKANLFFIHISILMICEDLR